MNILFLTFFASTLIWSLIFEHRFFLIFTFILVLKYIIEIFYYQNNKKFLPSIFQKSTNPTVLSIIPIKLDKIDKFLKKYNLENPENKITYTHIGLKALSMAMMSTPKINGYFSYNNFHHMDSTGIGVIISLNDNKDLFAKTVRNAENLQIHELPPKLRKHVRIIKQGKDKMFKVSKFISRLIPSYLLSFFGEFFGYFFFNFLLKIKNTDLFKKNFGLAGLTNVSSFGLREACACHISLVKSAYILLMGTADKKAVVVNGKIEIQNVMNIGITSDYRLGTGDDFLIAVNKIKEIFENFENYIK